VGNKNIAVKQIIKSALKKLMGPILKRFHLILEKLDYITKNADFRLFDDPVRIGGKYLTRV
jgi:hypothetical protein